ncbi:MAG TPA: methyl-accepting chemotaxis protein [Syntrophales bacterium]|nr:methyl-accepting chemotaxis protein [Syntrophales bacterium]HOM07831.1 methyl-accepting chemotaxis protein [Syntrophales bacterium]HOO00535.1 methyl-accepting chemotaxis protein [Syntrophales bacterium]HPQ07345.1 methyl-accepting chemotaxis protein [Syntrophales bacterium]HRS87760.1 methyl-accepting chemotaxis protein [Syntrophales bacterium]
MNWIKTVFLNMKMWQKMLLAPLLVLTLMIVLSVLSYYGLNSEKGALDDIFNNRFKGYQQISRIANEIANVHSNVYRVLSWANANYEAEKINALAKEQIKAIEKNINALQGILKGTNLNPQEKKLYQAALESLLEYQKPALGVLEVASADVNASTMFMGVTDETYQKMEKVLAELMALEERLSKEKYEYAISSFNNTMRVFVVFVVIAVIVSVLLSVLVSRAVVAPIYEVIGVAQRGAEGDLTQEIVVRSRDELGKLAEAVNTMCLKVGEAVGHSLAISQNLSDSASQQAASLEETSSAMDEMASMTRQTADHTAEAHNLMNAAKEAIQKANTSMTELEQSMKVIATSSEQTQSIVKSIDEIAFQTNLLALNAAVEAARAGEAGAGFAVVADEVRNLAMRATESAKNTSNLIEDIVKKVREGEKLVNVTGGAFNQVTGTSNKVLELIGEIATASQEQAEGINQINRALAELNQVTQHNAANAHELAEVMSIFKTAEGEDRGGTKGRTRYLTYEKEKV